MKIAVVGTGYVGLVAGSCLAETGNTVACVDIDDKKIARLNAGEIPIYEPGLEPLVKRNKEEKRLSFTTDLAAAVRAAEVIFIAVGTPSGEDGSADLQYVLAAARSIGKAANGPKVIVDKSTVPVGTAAKVKAAAQGETSHPIAVVSNPEFLKEGNAVNDFLKPDRVVIGCDEPRAAEVMKRLYAPFVRTGNPVIVMDVVSAELTKYAANAMLATRISFMNEIAQICERVGADVNKVREGIASDTRIGHSFLFPGVGYGGSCFPKDSKAIVSTAKEYGYRFRVMEAVEEVNHAQKRHLFDRLAKHWKGAFAGKTVALWGLAFKARTDDIREAPALVLIDLLRKAGATVKAFDPVAMEPTKKVVGDAVTMCKGMYEAAEGCDALMVVTEWNEFRNPDFERLKSLLREPTILDGRNLYDAKELRAQGYHYIGIGL
ncbi:MAG: UDP-glucose/GDP-mannose dehydrogenase family protein [Planctomycetes bacterium]|nr:UDP-glucose/GDP-mannose dehydrogenase family protein [Planctomycetota bacterium]